VVPVAAASAVVKEEVALVAAKHELISNVPTGKMIRITQIHSAIGHEASQGRTLRALGLRKMHQAVVKEDTPVIRGMIFKIQHLLRVEEMPAQEQGEEGAK
jgi:large subunit ribosomal protein L30